MERMDNLITFIEYDTVMDAYIYSLQGEITQLYSTDDLKSTASSIKSSDSRSKNSRRSTRSKKSSTSSNKSEGSRSRNTNNSARSYETMVCISKQDLETMIMKLI